MKSLCCCCACVIHLMLLCLTVVCALQGNCSALPPPVGSEFNVSGPDLLPLLSNQCLLVMDASHIALSGDVWLDSLYIRFQRIDDNPFYNALMRTSVNLYMTEITLQQYKMGGLKCSDCELWFYSNVLAQGTISSDSRISHIASNHVAMVPVANERDLAQACLCSSSDCRLYLLRL